MSSTQTNAMFMIVGLFGLLALILGFIILRGARRKNGEVSSPQDPAIQLPPDLPKEVSAETVTNNTSDQESAIATSPPGTKDGLGSALKNTQKSILGRLRSLFQTSASDHHFEDIEEILYTADLGPSTIERVLGSVRESLSRSEVQSFESLKSALQVEFTEIFSQAKIPEPIDENPIQFLSIKEKPTVWLIVGVNGAGKTTSIGKLAAMLAQSGKKVLVAAGDTFRAAAGSQLKVWTERAQVEIFSPDGVTDPSALAFDAVMKAKAGGYDLVLIDTAGRLHTQSHLMEELKKMKRVIQKALPEAPHETLIVLDANSGQNALVQAREFNQALGLTGVILTKMDGTAKGGVAVSLAFELGVPIRMIGLGEKLGDLRPFSAKQFLNSLFEA